MKKKVLCIAALLLYLLTACTLLSQRIEEEMQIEVMVRKLGNTSLELSASCLYEEAGQMRLYELVEGSGWEDGLRIRRSLQTFPAGTKKISIGSGDAEYVVQAASRQPREGEAAAVLSRQTLIADRYLLVYQDGIPELADEPEGSGILAEIITRGKNSLMLAVQNSYSPFMEHYAQGELRAYAGYGWRIYSLSAVTQLMDQLPALAVLALLLLIPVLLWIYGCFLARSPRRHIGCLCVNLGITVALLATVSFLLKSVELPSSLLPPHNILDWSYYCGEFSSIFAALAELGEDTAQTLQHARRMQAASMYILAGGAGFSAVVILTAGLIVRRADARDKRKQRKKDTE